MNKIFAFDQINAFTCYNCDKTDYIIRNYQASKKMNLNNCAKEMKKNVLDQDQKSSKK